MDCAVQKFKEFQAKHKAIHIVILNLVKIVSICIADHAKKRLSSGRNYLPHNSIHSVSVCGFLPTTLLVFLNQAYRQSLLNVLLVGKQQHWKTEIKQMDSCLNSAVRTKRI